RIVRSVARRQTQSAVIESDDSEAASCQAVEEQRIPQIHVSPKARAQDDWRAGANRSIGEPPTTSLHELVGSAHRCHARVQDAHRILPYTSLKKRCGRGGMSAPPSRETSRA